MPSFKDIARSFGGGERRYVTPGSMCMSQVVSCDPTQTVAAASNPASRLRVGTSSTVGPIFTFPKGAIPLYLINHGGATGGSSPTVDIGDGIDGDWIVNNVDADEPITAISVLGGLGVQPAGLLLDTICYGKQGGSAATGGTWTGVFVWTMADDGKSM